MEKVLVNEIYTGKVNFIKPYGAFLVFEDGTKGLLHISEISDSYIKDIEKFVSVGDEISVLILEIDEHDNFAKVSYKKVPDEKKFSTHINKKVVPVISADEFDVLKNKLDEWIELSLKEKEGKENGN